MKIGNYEINLETYLPYAWNVLGAVLALWIGIKIINKVTFFIGKRMEKRNMDPSLRPFLQSLVGILLKAALFISIAGMVGIKTTSFIAILGAAGLAVGMALQGSLGNFAGGVLILLFKPFKVGDLIEAQGYLGVVKEIQIFCTIMTTADNKTIIIPNGPLAGGSMVNFSIESKRRVDFTVGISYGDDLKKAKDVLTRIFENDKRVLKDPAPFVALGELADNSVNLIARVWVEAANYWPVFFDNMETIKLEFDREGLNFPFPQREITLVNAPMMSKESTTTSEATLS